MFNQGEEQLTGALTRSALRPPFIPIARGYDGQKFFTRVDGKLHGTLLLLVLATVEFTDLVFAVDSIPAIFGITTDPFIVYTSNVFAILGLRTFYFLLAGVVEKFHFLKTGLAVVLTFVGVKMLTEGFVHDYISKGNIILISLGFVVLVLALSVVASLIWPKEAETHIEVELPEGFGSPFDDDIRDASAATNGSPEAAAEPDERHGRGRR